jgi:hypothetical protein
MEEGEVGGEEDKQFESLDCALHRAIVHILFILAPSLYTLSLYIDCRSWLFLPFPPSFPLLTELSIKHTFTAGVFRSDALIALKTCPKLRKLVLTGFKCIFDPLDMIDRINTFGPNITHLCVPSEAQNMPVMLQSLKQQMTPPSPNPIHSTSTPTRFPQSIERLFIHSIRNTFAPFVFPIFSTGTKRVVLVERVWDDESIENGAGKGSETYLMWESMWVDGISGEGDGFWMYPYGHSESCELREATHVGRLP